MRHSGVLFGLCLFVVVLLFQLSIPSGIQPAFASRTYVFTPPLTDVATVDSGYPTTTGAGSAYTVDYQGINCGTTLSRYMETFLKFNTANIPPQATIVTAALSASLSYAKVAATVGAYYEPDSSWSQGTLTWSNHVASGSTLYGSTFVSNSTSNYQWDVTQALVTNNPTQSEFTFILFPTSSQSANCNGWIDFVPSSISLSVTYSYASASVLLSSNSIQYGNSVTITGSTDPPQSGGTMSLEYSTDQVTWNILQTQGGGASTYTWKPPSSGTYYLASVWSTSWNGGSYSTSSQPIQLNVAQAPSSIQLSLSSDTIIVGESVTLAITFITPSSISDGTVTILYSTDGNTWNVLVAVGPSSGAWSNYDYIWTPSSVATYYLRAYWSGDTNYLTSPYSIQTLSVAHEPTSITLSAPSSIHLDQQVTVSATLLDSADHPIAGAQLSFQFASTSIGIGTTDSSGTASLVFTPSVSAGTYTITVSYAGSNLYAASSSQRTIQIIPWQLTISSSAPNVPLVAINGQYYTTDSTGTAIIQIPLSGSYTLTVNSPLVFASGSRYVFVQWGDGSTALTKNINIASDTSLSIIMKIQYKLTIQSPYGSPLGDAWYDAGSNAQFMIHSPVDQHNGTRRVFLSWTKNSQLFATPANGSLTMAGPITLQAAWKKQYSLDITSQYGNPTGGGWNDAGSTAVVSVQSPFNVTNGVRFILTGFIGTGAAPRSGNATRVTFTISSPSSLTFSWRPQYFVSLQSSGGTTNGGGKWYNGGATVIITATSPSNVVQNVSRLIFTGWTGVPSSNKTIQFTAGQPYNITANWVQQYYVTASTAMGQIKGIGWYNKSSSATIEVSPTAFGFLIQQVFGGWAEGVPNNGGVSSFVVTGPVNLHATWRNDYTQLLLLVAVIAIGGGAGGFYFVRRGRQPTLERKEPAKVEPSQTEPSSQTVVKSQPEPETGTSVYIASACPACGAVNPVGAVFCGSCGADLQHQ